MNLDWLADNLQTSTKVWLLFVLINVFTFFLFGFDKWLAIKGMSRVSERTLFISSLFGGSPGATLAMFVFRHKLRKRSFRLTMLLIIAIQLAGLLWLVITNYSNLKLSA
jgi:uncharacterized membrane protein YsdA (DUF1294 family)